MRNDLSIIDAGALRENRQLSERKKYWLLVLPSMTTLLQVKIEVTARTEVYEGMRISSTSQALLNRVRGGRRERILATYGSSRRPNSNEAELDLLPDWLSIPHKKAEMSVFMLLVSSTASGQPFLGEQTKMDHKEVRNKK